MKAIYKFQRAQSGWAPKPGVQRWKENCSRLLCLAYGVPVSFLIWVMKVTTKRWPGLVGQDVWWPPRTSGVFKRWPTWSGKGKSNHSLCWQLWNMCFLPHFWLRFSEEGDQSHGWAAAMEDFYELRHGGLFRSAPGGSHWHLWLIEKINPFCWSGLAIQKSFSLFQLSWLESSSLGVITVNPTSWPGFCKEGKKQGKKTH